MIRKRVAAVAALFVAGCAVQRPVPAPAPTSVVDVQILALNDFHGNVDRPADPVRFELGPDQFATSPAGGAAIVGQELANLRSGHDHTITVAAGDLIGASPLTSAYFLDEPTIDAMNLMGLSLASVGNHEFDKGSAELLRMQNGGCEKHTTRVPCRLEPFEGAHFEYLAANVLRGDGTTIFPGTAIRQFGPIRIGFIGMTLKDTGVLVTPSGVAGLRFADEATTANGLVPQLKAAGADTIVLLIHQGGHVPDSYHLRDCDGLTGDILPILDKLDPAIATVISGHTHHAYECEIERGGVKRLLTSAGKYGYFVSDLRLDFDPATHRLLAQHARTVPMIRQGSGDPAIAALVKRYADAAAPAASRIVGHLSGGPARKSEGDGESPAANLIADAQLAATKAPNRGAADISFINATGVRTDLLPLPDGRVTYGAIFALQPFGNNLVVKTLTGAQLKAVLEQQFKIEGGTAKVASLLVPARRFRFTYDLSKPDGQRIVVMTLDGKPIDPNRRYRVTVNNFLASGGDGFSAFNSGTDTFDAGLDLDALEAWLATNPTVPTDERVTNSTPH
ncbi:MAG TPA: bifunctional metallophosphatase/5'-nucleotidase [Sphingomicrobium sp.]